MQRNFKRTSEKSILKKRLDLIDDKVCASIARRWIFELPESECIMYISILGERDFEAFVLTHKGHVLTSHVFHPFRPSSAVSDLIIHILSD